MKAKIRIALAIDHTGSWYACGWGFKRSLPPDKTLMDSAVTGVVSGEVRYWLDAEVEVPVVEKLEAKVTPA